MTATESRSYADKAATAYEGQVPDWVAELAAHADRHGAKKAGAAIGYSNGAVSMVLNNKAGNLDVERIEQAVRGALMGLTVDCPVYGEIGRDACLANQKLPFSAHRRERVALWHACRNGCPHSRVKGGDDVA